MALINPNEDIDKSIQLSVKVFCQAWYVAQSQISAQLWGQVIELPKADT